MDTEQITSGDIAAAVKETEQPAPASPAAQPETTGKAPASAIETPAVVAEKKSDEYGPLPFERHKAILDSTRESYESKLKGLSWAEGLTRDEVEEALALNRLYRTQPERLYSHLSERVKTSAEPPPDTKDERGDPYYSPQQAAKWAVWEANRIVDERMAELEERIGPIESTFTKSQQVERLNEQIGAASEWPGFAEHVDDITAAIADANSKRRKLSLHEAYIRVVAPKLANTTDTRLAEEKKKWLAELNNTTERVQGDVKPNSGPAPSRKRDSDKSLKELLQEEHDARARA